MPRPPPRDDARAAAREAAYRKRLDQAKHGSTLQLLFKASRLLDAEALRRVGEKRGRPKLRPSHTSLLPHIDLDGTRITDLADRVGVTKQAVSQLVDELEAFGVVTRVPDPEDARARRVVFTARGRDGLLEGLAVLGALEAELAAAVGSGRMKALRSTLLAVLEHIAAMPAEAEE